MNHPLVILGQGSYTTVIGAVRGRGARGEPATTYAVHETPVYPAELRDLESRARPQNGRLGRVRIMLDDRICPGCHEWGLTIERAVSEPDVGIVYARGVLWTESCACGYYREVEREEE